jgi:hypothetical protein
MKRIILKLCLLSVLGGVYAYATTHAPYSGPLIKAKCCSGGYCIRLGKTEIKGNS